MYSFLVWIFLVHIKCSISAPIADFRSKALPSIFDTPILNDKKSIHPDFLQISIKKLKTDRNDEINAYQDERQIPGISDIERIKKVIELIEYVGEKVGDLLDKIQLPNDPSEPIYDYRSSENNNTAIS